LKKEVEINFDHLLNKYREEFPVSSIYTEDKLKESSGLVRKLTNFEKRKILENFFSRYFFKFFERKGRPMDHFLFGKIKLVKKDQNPFIHWYDQDFENFHNNLKMSFENVDSDLISNLTSNYQQQYDVDMLEHL